MAKKQKVQFFVEDKDGKPLDDFASKTVTALFNKLPQGTIVRFSADEGQDFGKQFIGEYEVKGLPEGPSPPPDVNKPPVVNAGEDIQVKENVLVTLDGTAADTDGQVVNVLWQQLSGPDVQLFTDQGDNTKVTFTSPALPQGVNSMLYEFLLKATDDKGATEVDTIKVTVANTDVPPPPPPPPGGEVWGSEKWTFDGPAITLPKDQPNKNWVVGGSPSGWISPFDPQTVLSHAGTAGPAVFDGKGAVKLTGNQSRMYILADNFDNVLTLTLIPNFQGSGDDCSLKLVSQHNDGGAPDNRPGGEGWAVGPGTWDSKREDYHNVHTKLGSGSLSQKLENGKPYKLKFTVQHESNKIHLIGEVDYGQGFKKECDVFDSNPLASFMTHKKPFYFWIRNNGSGSIEVREASVEPAQ